MQAGQEMHMILHSANAVEVAVQLFVNAPDVGVELVALIPSRFFVENTM